MSVSDLRKERTVLWDVSFNQRGPGFQYQLEELHYPTSYINPRELLTQGPNQQLAWSVPQEVVWALGKAWTWE